MKYVRYIIFLILCIASLSFPALLKRLTHSVNLNRCRLSIENNTMWDVPPLISSEELGEIIRQKFIYLDRGAQSFIFSSSDQKYVLKLFFFDGVEKPQVFEGCRIASLYAPQLTGLVYLHLNVEKEGPLPSVQFEGPLWRRQKLNLNQVRFAIQKKAVRLEDALLHCYKTKNWSEFSERVESFLKLIQARAALGILNRDTKLQNHYGFVETRSIEIDFGYYVLSKKPENLHDYVSQLISWIEHNTPEWSVPFYEKFGFYFSSPQFESGAESSFSI